MWRVWGLQVDQTGHFQTHHTTILKYVEHKDFYPTGLLNLEQKYVCTFIFNYYVGSISKTQTRIHWKVILFCTKQRRCARALSMPKNC